MDTTGSVAELTARLAVAVDAASDAYRHSTRLIRLLTVLGQPSSPEELVEQTLLVLSQVYAADVAAIARVDRDRVVVTHSCGLAEEDPAHTVGWPVAGGIARMVATGDAVEHVGGELSPEDVPPSLADLHLRSGVWVPLSGGSGVGQVLLLLRGNGTPLTATELQVLRSVTMRLGAAIESRARVVAVERLARSGHRLARCVDAQELVRVAAELLPHVLSADAGHVVTVRGGEITGHAATPGTPVVSPFDVRDASLLPGWTDLVRGEPVRTVDGQAQAVLGAPVMRGDTVVAALYVLRDAGVPFPPEAAEIVSIFANYLAAALTNAELYLALRNSEDELRERATHDSLTGLANRVLLHQRLNEMLTGARGRPVGLLFCDLDGFKQVNDRLGHDVGDELLVRVAERLGSGLHGHDVLARFGGDEFVVLLNNVDDRAALRDVGQRLVELVEQPFPLRGETVEISVSVGGVLGIPGTSRATEMLRDADAAMYAAKRAGTGRVEIFDDEASSRSLDLLELRSDLGMALSRNQLWLQYQPIVDLVAGGVLGFEALLRWNHPARGQISPAVFIPLAEENGSIAGIGEWVLSEACRQLAAWQRVPGCRDLEISVNMSPTQLGQPGITAQTLAVVRRAGVLPRHVWLEITEQGAVHPGVTDAATALHEAGIRFALDDFGIAHANLNHLKRLPIDRLKVDRSFVDAVDTGDMDRAIVRAVLAIADSLGMSAVAQGVETAGQRAALAELGCRQAQGYLFARPMSARDATALLISQALPLPPALAG